MKILKKIKKLFHPSGSSLSETFFMGRKHLNQDFRLFARFVKKEGYKTESKNMKLLISKSSPKSFSKKRKGKILMTCFHDIYNAKSAVDNFFAMALRLSEHYDITYVASAYIDNKKIINKHFTYFSVKHDPEFFQEVTRSEKKGNHIISIYHAFIKKSHKMTKFREFVSEIANQSDLVILDHPMTYNFFSNLKKTPIVIFAYDIVHDIISNNFDLIPGYNNDKYKTKVLKDAYDFEKKAFKKAKVILTVSEDDISAINEKYDIPKNKMRCVGAFFNNQIEFLSKAKKNKIKKRFKIKNPVVLFMGGDWYPNIKPCEIMIKIAKNNANINFLIIGGIGGYFYRKNIKEFNLPNVFFTGLVPNSARNIALNIADVAINFADMGGGISTKVFDYIASGTPVIANSFGARGNKFLKDNVIICNKEKEVEKVLISGDYSKLVDTNKSNIAIRKKYSLDSVMERYFDELERCLTKKTPVRSKK